MALKIEQSQSVLYTAAEDFSSLKGHLEHHKLSDQELESIRTNWDQSSVGSDELRWKVVMSFSSRAYALVAKRKYYVLHGMRFDLILDLLSELNTALWEDLKDYDKTRGALHAYLYMKTKFWLLNAMNNGQFMGHAVSHRPNSSVTRLDTIKYSDQVREYLESQGLLDDSQLKKPKQTIEVPIELKSGRCVVRRGALGYFVESLRESEIIFSRQIHSSDLVFEERNKTKSRYEQMAKGTPESEFRQKEIDKMLQDFFIQVTRGQDERGKFIIQMRFLSSTETRMTQKEIALLWGVRTQAVADREHKLKQKFKEVAKKIVRQGRARSIEEIQQAWIKYLEGLSDESQSESQYE